MPQWEKVFSVPNGVPGMEFLVPLMLHEGVNKGRTTLIKLVEQLSEKPAKIFGLYPKKGTISKGSDADIAIFDLSAQRLLDSTHPELKIDYNLYEGMSVTAPPELVMLRGRVISRRGVVCGGAGGGKFVAGNINAPRTGNLKKQNCKDNI
jgi:dihydropyrimidinase